MHGSAAVGAVLASVGNVWRERHERQQGGRYDAAHNIMATANILVTKRSSSRIPCCFCLWQAYVAVTNNGYLTQDEMLAVTVGSEWKYTLQPTSSAATRGALFAQFACMTGESWAGHCTLVDTGWLPWESGGEAW